LFENIATHRERKEVPMFVESLGCVSVRVQVQKHRLGRADFFRMFGSLGSRPFGIKAANT
jgi:hypothetical protein